MIKTAVIPVAGFGTRMLPASKSTSKEMLPLADKPIIEYVIEECKQAGIEHVILVTNANKADIENYFDRNYELENQLESAGKFELLSTVRQPQNEEITISAVRQSEAKGLGHAILCAKNIIANQPFAVLLPDVIVQSKENSFSDNPMLELIEQFEVTRSSQILVEPVAENEVNKYGIVEMASSRLSINRSKPLSGIVEKPEQEEAPSNLAVVGRYVFASGIWKHLENTESGVGGEIQLTDAILTLMEEEAVYALPLDGVSKDCGCKLGYYKAFVEEILAREDDLSEQFQAFLESLSEKSEHQKSSDSHSIRLAG
ncbi:MAG: UTP--glucose-1-phosphate uridylyltransferase [Kangiellaceae bacterium]|nr:UTP--glucose-1-phosphate uridylyltransferase [Kangiellaceae bacterium]